MKRSSPHSWWNPLWASILCCLSFTLSFAQKPLPHLLHADEYLRQIPRFSAYDLQVDSNNLLHIASSAGLFSFNGTQLEIIERQAGLENYAFEGLYKDANGRLWTKAYKGFLGLLHDGKVVPYAYNDLLDDRFKKRLEAFHQDADDKTHLAPRGHGYFTVSKAGKLEEVFGRSSDIFGFVVCRLPDGTPFHFSISSREKLDQNEPFRLYYWDGLDSLRILTEFASSFAIFHSSLVAHQDSSFTLSIGTNELVSFWPDSLIEQVQFPETVLNLFEDHQQNLWIGTLRGGLHRVQNRDFTHTDHFLGGIAAQVTGQDQDGGLWIKADSGFFHYIPDLQSRSYHQIQLPWEVEEIRFLLSDNERVFAISSNHIVSIFSADSVQHIPIPRSPFTNRSNYVSPHPESAYYDTERDWLWIGYWGQLLAYDGTQWHTYTFPDSIIEQHSKKGLHVRGIAQTPDGFMLAATTSGLVRIQRDGTLRFEWKRNGPKLINQLVVDDEGTIWLGAENGLWYLKEDSILAFTDSDSLAQIFQGSIRSLANSMGKIWVQVGEYGLFSIQNGKAEQVRDSKGEVVNLLETIVGPKGDLWGRRKVGKLKLIQISEKQGKREVIEHHARLTNSQFESALGELLAITSREVFSVASRHILVINQNDLQQIPPQPNVLIKNVFINHQPVPTATSYDLPHDENSLYIAFAPINYTQKGLLYSHRLIGWDDEWQVSTHSEIQYTNLDPGDYEFQLKIRTTADAWITGPKIAIHIDAPYWETWWFRTLGVLALVGCIALVFYLRYRILARRSLMQIEKLMAEQRALRAQMNPHFIFNALGSIQELVFSKERMFAVTNISEFALLMRKVLYHSSQDVVTLTEEIELLRLYLRLEALRFDDNFNLSVEISDSLDPEVCLIPPLLLQPLVENAIKHGLLPANPPGGTISIKFDRHVNGILCIVEDNGVGRGASVKQAKSGIHQSFGLKTIKERIELLNVQKSEKITLNIVDLMEGEQAAGTRIELVIP